MRNELWRWRSLQSVKAKIEVSYINWSSDATKYQSVSLTVTTTTAGIFWKHYGSFHFELENGLGTG